MMKRTGLFSALLAGALASAGCSHNKTGVAQPNNMTGRAATTSSGTDSVGNVAPGDATGPNAPRAPNPGETPGQETGGGPDQQQPPADRGINPGATPPTQPDM